MSMLLSLAGVPNLELFFASSIRSESFINLNRQIKRARGVLVADIGLSEDIWLIPLSNGLISTLQA
jgi:hypothetical protein